MISRREALLLLPEIIDVAADSAENRCGAVGLVGRGGVWLTDLIDSEYKERKEVRPLNLSFLVTLFQLDYLTAGKSAVIIVIGLGQIQFNSIYI